MSNQNNIQGTLSTMLGQQQAYVQQLNSYNQSIQNNNSAQAQAANSYTQNMLGSTQQPPYVPYSALTEYLKYEWIVDEYKALIKTNQAELNEDEFATWHRLVYGRDYE